MLSWIRPERRGSPKRRMPARVQVCERAEGSPRRAFTGEPSHCLRSSFARSHRALA